MGKSIGHDEVTSACESVLSNDISGLGVSPFNLKKARELLRGSDVNLITGVGYPMGYSATTAKVEEIKRAINDGAHQVDVALNVASVKSQAWNYFENDVESTIRVAHLKNVRAFLVVENIGWEKDDLKRIIEVAITKEVNGICLHNLIDPIPPTDPNYINLIRSIAGGALKIKVPATTKLEINDLIGLGADAIAVQSLDL